MNFFIKSFLDLVFPPLCHLCRTFIPQAGELHICPACRDGFHFINHPLCSTCGTPFLAIGNDHVCSACQKSPPAFQSARAALVYEAGVSQLIHSFKYGHATHLRRPLALLMLEQLNEWVISISPDLIIPVPLHIKRLRQRGFNQAVLIAEIVGQRCAIPVCSGILQRRRWTEPQINLKSEERQQNVKGAFAVKDDTLIQGKKVLLLDDVYTTGSTVRECSASLMLSGAKEVFVSTVVIAVKL